MNQPAVTKKILMLLENESYPEDIRVLLEARSLLEAGFAVTVISPTGKRARLWYEVQDNVQVYRYPKPWEIEGFLGYLLEYGYSLVMQFMLTCWVGLWRGFDVIHMHTPPDLNAIIPVFFKIFGKKFVYDLHDLSPELYRAKNNGEGSQLVYRVLRWFERLACTKADRLIATNESQRAVQYGRGGASKEHCYVVRNGPYELFLDGAKPLDELTSDARLVIGYVGVIGVQDGVDYLIRALAELGRNDFRCVIVGGGPALAEIKQLAGERGLSGQIEFTGMIPFADVPRYIASFDICVTPDPSNPYNDSCTTIKTMEYMALGKPTVCFETKENQLTAGPAALYAKDSDVCQLAARIAELMDNPALREDLGRIGRERIDNGFTWAHQAENLITLYDDLFGRVGESIGEVGVDVEQFALPVDTPTSSTHV